MSPRVSSCTLLAICLLPWTAQARGTSGRIQAPFAPARGIVLRLALPRGPYVGRELIEATVTLQNRSLRTIFVRGTSYPSRTEVAGP